ncbi:hypothetical protein [Desulfobulbus propionicus]|jgi:hypothetical protein|uniref:hypothetical protein n=1 Tax=Desulfobulbus propionicus TaxID=894 RepID=UPI00146EB479|nr:hypothetical protein [Desulfobulbus propionicus]
MFARTPEQDEDKTNNTPIVKGRKIFPADPDRNGYRPNHGCGERIRQTFRGEGLIRAGAALLGLIRFDSLPAESAPTLETENPSHGSPCISLDRA